MSQGLLITGIGESAGKSLVTIGLLRDAAEHFDRIGFLRPITSSDSTESSRIVSLAEQLLPEGTLHAASVMTAAEAERQIADGRLEDVISACLDAYERLAADTDLVIVEGSNSISVRLPSDVGFNVELAKHLGVPTIGVIDGSGRSAARIAAAVALTRRELIDAHSTLIAVIVNRAPLDQIEEAARLLPAGRLGRPVYLIPNVDGLTWPSVGEIARRIGATRINETGDEDALVRRITVAAMQPDHALEVIGAGAFVVVPADRDELLSAILRAPLSPEAVLISGDFALGPVGQQAVAASRIPVYTLDTDTFAAAQAASHVRAEIGEGNPTRVRLAQKIWQQYVDGGEILSRLDLRTEDVTTPERFTYELARRARAIQARIVLPEGEDPRILTAAADVTRRGLVRVTVLGRPDDVRALAAQHGVQLGDIEIIDVAASPLLEEFATEYQKLRAHKGVTIEQARAKVAQPTTFATMLVHTGRADGLVSGASHTTADTIRPAFEIIKTRPGVSTVSSVLFMCLDDRVFVYGDCAVIPNPTPQQLAEIAVASAGTARAFGVEPRVALLSYSTGQSGHGSDVDAVREATAIAHELAPQLPIEGPIQYDAASNAVIAAGKLPDSDVAGRATVFVFPDLNTGNNTYKAVQQASGALAIGPVLQGLNKPVNDLSRGCTVDDVINTILITAIQSQAIA